MDQQTTSSIIRRLLALAIDFSLLAFIGFLSGFLLEDFYVSLAGYGTLAGSAFVIVYFTTLQSNIGKGQTLGKRIVKIQVMSLAKQYLTVRKSLLRSLMVFFPLMNIGMLSSGSFFLIIQAAILYFIFVFGYFVLVNKSRRGLHDILVSSVVLNKGVTDFQIGASNNMGSKKLIPVGVLGVLIISGAVYFTFAETELTQFLHVKESIEKREDVIKVINMRVSQESRNVNITVRIDAGLESLDKESAHFSEINAIVRREFPEAEEVTINLYSGYNIGLESKTQGVTKIIGS
ncbi:MAG: RDD family protein [Ekhidna sp.]